MQPEQEEHQEEHQQERRKDLHAAMLGQRGGQKRMAGLSSQERSALAKHAARTRWHPLEVKVQREHAEEIARAVKQALDAYLPVDKHGA